MAAKPKQVSEEAEIAAWNRKLSKAREEKRKTKQNVTSRIKKRNGDD